MKKVGKQHGKEVCSLFQLAGNYLGQNVLEDWGEGGQTTNMGEFYPNRIMNKAHSLSPPTIYCFFNH